MWRPRRNSRPPPRLLQRFFPDGPFAHGLFVEALTLFVLRRAAARRSAERSTPQIGTEEVHGDGRITVEHSRRRSQSGVWKASCKAVGVLVCGGA